jgi:two-component system phosphate regulon sensor histidine kinase PhoR
MFSSIRWRLVFPFVSLLLILMLALGVFLTSLVRQFRIDELRVSLETNLLLLDELLVAEPFTPENAEMLDPFARTWAEKLGFRVTLVTLDGIVLGESDEDRLQMDNHATRPEIIDALTDDFGSSIRFSTTTQFDRLYVARVVMRAGQPVGVIRLSVTLEQIEDDLALISNAIAVATLVATLVAGASAVIVASRTTHPLRGLTEASRKIADGQFDIAIHSQSRDEVGELTQAVAQMSNQLQGQIRELDGERNKLAAILRQMNNGVVIVSPGQTIELFNQAAEHMFGVSEASLLDKSLVEGLRNHHVVEIVRKAKKTREVLTRPLELPSQNRLLDMTAVSLGAPLAGHILLIFRDMTRIRNLETIRQDFVSNISHELRTPLASLKALTETLMDGALDDPPAARRFLTRIETEVDSLSLMVSELLELARIESGKVPLSFKPVSPKSLLTTAVERLYLQAERAELKILVETTPDLPNVLTDPPRLEQVLMNLIHNAIKFTSAGGSITVSAQAGRAEHEGFIIFSVRDTGIGIAPDDLPRIFERFYKSDRARTRSEGGTGLGLAISRHLVEAHGGQIWVESILEQGSTFSFSLPITLETG